jgi:hypothetical protein
MQFRIVGHNLDAMPLVVPCSYCKAPAGKPCDYRGGVADRTSHLVRQDKASRQSHRDLYGCKRCKYACDCSPKAARWLPTMTVVERVCG